MLATGGSCIATIELVLERGAKEEQIMFVGVVGASEGIQRVHEHFPHITMIIAAEDKILNNKNLLFQDLVILVIDTLEQNNIAIFFYSKMLFYTYNRSFG